MQSRRHSGGSNNRIVPKRSKINIRPHCRTTSVSYTKGGSCSCPANCKESSMAAPLSGTSLSTLADGLQPIILQVMVKEPKMDNHFSIISSFTVQFAGLAYIPQFGKNYWLEIFMRKICGKKISS